ncbi:YqeG family HAD IIIA-type phosphatase [Phosphitispora sp. TUW77]|uniref:YqeG family HAD IIIA-type phosphatase n=1 Tax=Phosphitispora sp. TUW77 TaxID=3152361 RepID=UPI003AB2B532
MFHPDAYIISLTDMEPGFFTERGIKGLIIDLDNTLLSWKSGTIEPEICGLLQDYIAAGIKLCVVSNALNSRVAAILGPLGIPGVARARKPMRKPFLMAMNILGTQKDETAVIGDQIFTDVYGGNRMGFYTVLVEPISKTEFIGTRIVRIAEKIVLRNLAKN